MYLSWSWWAVTQVVFGWQFLSPSARNPFKKTEKLLQLHKHLPHTPINCKPTNSHLFSTQVSQWHCCPAIKRFWVQSPDKAVWVISVYSRNIVKVLFNVLWFSSTVHKHACMVNQRNLSPIKININLYNDETCSYRYIMP